LRVLREEESTGGVITKLGGGGTKFLLKLVLRETLQTPHISL